MSRLKTVTIPEPEVDDVEEQLAAVVDARDIYIYIISIKTIRCATLLAASYGSPAPNACGSDYCVSAYYLTKPN